MSIKIIKPGMLLTIQDLGRKGYQKYGIIESGSMDPLSLRLANILAGNAQDEAALEMTLLGPTIYFESNTLIAICGGDFSASIDGYEVPLWRPVLIQAGSILKMGPAKSGARAYLAVAGGFGIDKQMGSRSTYLRAGIGGFEGRALKAGDVLELRRSTSLSQSILHYPFKNEQKPFVSASQTIAAQMRPHFAKNPVIRVTKGTNFHLFTKESQDLFFSAPFKVLPQSDRMGYRLEGPPIVLSEQQEMLSEAVSFGTVQVPANGQPIVLMADHQTTGGYPKIAHVVSVDLPIMAQLSLGSEVYFEEISLKKAQELYINRERDMRIIQYGINQLLKKMEVVSNDSH